MNLSPVAAVESVLSVDECRMVWIGVVWAVSFVICAPEGLERM